jgi:hypothetical protein
VPVTVTRERTGEIVRKVFEVLLSRPEGLSARAVIASLEESLSLTETERDPDRLRPSLRAFEATAYRGSIAPVKAGWLHEQDGTWKVTEEGKRAWEQFRDPETFLLEAGHRSLKGWLSVRFPGTYSLTGVAKTQLVTEYKMIRRIGLGKLVRRMIPAPGSWRESLPIQRPGRFVLPEAGFHDLDQLRRHLAACDAPYTEGGHTLYLSPAAARRSVFARVMERYPENAGLKIIKNAGGIDDTGYIRDASGHFSWIHSSITHNHRHLTLIANLFTNEGLGPRLYDLTEIQCGEHLWSAYVIEHIDGGEPSAAAWEAGLKRIRGLEKRGWIRTTLPDGYEDEEFRFPECGGNVLVDRDDRFHYVDFQNFLLLDYEAYLRELARQAAAASHFGETRLWRGGKYLYQTVPGVRLPGKRDTDTRVDGLIALMMDARVSVEDRLVLDVGCNIGMMMAEYLRLGARWCHGWDRAAVTRHAERLLLAVGGTRFSTTGADLEPSRSLEADLPAFLKPLLDRCAVSYLNVRGHIGWLDALARLPWSFLIYEGHEGETEADLREHISQLRKQTPCRLAASRTLRDGDSDARIAAILVR